MSTTAAPAKKPSITYTLTITAEGKDDLTFADVKKMEEHGNKMKEALKAFGAVEGAVTFGKQTLKL